MAMRNTDSDTVAIYGLAGLDPKDFSGPQVNAAAAQVVAPANPKRTGYQIQNNSAAVLWITDNGAAPVANAAGAIQVAANGGIYTTPVGCASKLAVQTIGGATGSNYTYREW